MDRAALLHLLSLHPWLLQGQLAPPIDGLLGRRLSCFPSHSLGFQLQSHFMHLRSLGGPLQSYFLPFAAEAGRSPSAAPAGARRHYRV